MVEGAGPERAAADGFFGECRRAGKGGEGENRKAKRVTIHGLASEGVMDGVTEAGGSTQCRPSDEPCLLKDRRVLG